MKTKTSMTKPYKASAPSSGAAHAPSAPARNWQLPGAPVLIDVRNQICTRITPSSPLWLRRYAWAIRQAPRLAVRRDRAFLIWQEWRTSCPPAYKSAIYGAAR